MGAEARVPVGENIVENPESDCCALAAFGGHLEVLKWLRMQDCPWDGRCALAAQGGHLEVLQWAREQGCPWEEDLDDQRMNCCTHAARGGHLEVLEWLRE